METLELPLFADERKAFFKALWGGRLAKGGLVGLIANPRVSCGLREQIKNRTRCIRLFYAFPSYGYLHVTRPTKRCSSRTKLAAQSVARIP